MATTAMVRIQYSCSLQEQVSIGQCEYLKLNDFAVRLRTKAILWGAGIIDAQAEETVSARISPHTQAPKIRRLPTEFPVLVTIPN